MGPLPIYALSLHVADSRNEETELAKQISDKIAGHKGDGDELTNKPFSDHNCKSNVSSKLDVMYAANGAGASLPPGAGKRRGFYQPLGESSREIENLTGVRVRGGLAEQSDRGETGHGRRPLAPAPCAMPRCRAPIPSKGKQRRAVFCRKHSIETQTAVSVN